MQAVDTWASNSTLGEHTTLYDAFETYPLGKTRFFSHGRAFFVPPASGNYTFLCAGDDYATLTGTLFNGTAVPLCSVPRNTAFRSFDYPGQIGTPVDLISGEPVLLNLSAYQGGGADHWTVGVQAPGLADGSMAWNSISKVQVRCQ